MLTDGSIEKAEWEAVFGPGSFDAWDANHDGAIDYAEWKKIFTSKTSKLVASTKEAHQQHQPTPWSSGGSRAASQAGSQRGSQAGSKAGAIEQRAVQRRVATFEQQTLLRVHRTRLDSGEEKALMVVTLCARDKASKATAACNTYLQLVASCGEIPASLWHLIYCICAVARHQCV